MPKFEKMPRQTREMGAPENWNEEENGVCHTLSIRDEVNEGLNMMWHRLSFSPEELEVLANGGFLEIGINGVRHPVVSSRVSTEQA